MEVERNVKPKDDFLIKVCKLSKKYKTVLIFDECTSGFRQNYGGIYKNYNLSPDMVTYGKAIGNGYALTAIVGKKKIMKCAEQSFISSTFWSERIGFVAGLATLEYMKKYKTWEKINTTGEYIKKEWLRLSNKYNLNLNIFGTSGIPQFTFSKKNLIYKTYLTQEMLKKNILASNTIYVSISHTKPILKYYFLCLERVFKDISKKNITRKSVKGKIAFNTFKRLN
jgi:glutamate-1-semialdehyde 2,1-aminomutase